MHGYAVLQVGWTFWELLKARGQQSDLVCALRLQNTQRKSFVTRAILALACIDDPQHEKSLTTEKQTQGVPHRTSSHHWPFSSLMWLSSRNHDPALNVALPA